VNGSFIFSISYTDGGDEGFAEKSCTDSFNFTLESSGGIDISETINNSVEFVSSIASFSVAIGESYL